MSCEVCQLKELEVGHFEFEIREVLRWENSSFLHCIDPSTNYIRKISDHRADHFKKTGSSFLDDGIAYFTANICLFDFVSFFLPIIENGILHTILFHRALGLVRPKDVDLELFEITYVQCGDLEIEKKIDEKIEQFISWVEKHPNKKSQICLSFYEVKNKQGSWFSNKIERLYWEQWYINLSVSQLPRTHSGKSHRYKVVVDPRAITTESAMEESSARRAALEASLRDVLFQIIKFVNEKKDHIPPIPNREGVISYPYEITIPSSSDTAFGMDVIKRMLQQTGHPTMLS